LSLLQEGDLRLTGCFGLLAAALVAAAQVASAEPRSAAEASAAVTHWLRLDAAPFGARLGDKPGRTVSLRQAGGEVFAYAVYLKPAGFAIVPADDEVEPIVGFSTGTEFVLSDRNPLGALALHDVRGRVEEARRAAKSAGPGKARTRPPHAETARMKWRILLDRLPTLDDASVKSDAVTLLGLSSLSDLRVAPFVMSKWDQLNEGTYCYNYYTPNHYYCGCVATMMAQLMRHHQWPASGVGTNAFAIKINGVAEYRNLRGGDGVGGPYSWADMPLDPDASTTETQRQAIGAVCHDAGVAARMSYSSSGSGASMEDALYAMVNVFGYSGGMYASYYNGSDISGPILNKAMNPNLHARTPVMLGILRSTSGHAVLCDGYGYNSGTLYHHLNMGWSGNYNAWYNLPTIDSYPSYNTVFSCVYNLYTSGSGEIISGRVTDSVGGAVTGVTVTACSLSGETYTGITDDRGLYAIVKVPSSTHFSLTAARTGYTFTATTVDTGQSISQTVQCGNIWGADLVTLSVPPPDDPGLFTAWRTNTTSVDLRWALNGAGDSVLLAWSTNGVFGIPAGPYAAGGQVPGGGTVLYVGAGTNIAHAGLQSATAYSYRAWSFDAATNYSAGTSIVARTLVANPTAFAAWNRSNSGIDLRWTRNSAGNNVLVAWKTNGVFGVPEGPCAAGDQIPGGGTVLYAGAGTNTSHAGLLPGTTYDYRAWSFDAGPNYSAGTSITARTRAIVTPPPDFAAWDRSASDIDLRWERNASNDSVMVAWSADGVFGVPAGTYAAGDQIPGGGTVIFSGGGTNASHTGLAPGTVYNYRAWSFDADSTYSTGTSIVARTMAANPTAFAARSPSVSRIDLQWTRNASNDSVMVAWSVNGVFGVPAGTYAAGDLVPGGGTVLYAGAGTNTSHTGLAPGAVCNYRAWSFDASANYSAGTSIVAQTLSAVALPAAFTAWNRSASGVDLQWVRNSAGDNVLVAWKTDGAFGTPSDVYAPGEEIPGGGVVLCSGSGTNVSHTGLPQNTVCEYAAWSFDAGTNYSGRTSIVARTSFVYYVNDASTAGDVWCSAPGNDSNPGLLPGAPKASLQAVIDAYDLDPGDSVLIDTGTYVLQSNIVVGQADEGSARSRVAFIGSPNGVTIDRNCGTNGSYGLFLDRANYISLSDLTVTSGWYSVHFSNANACVVSNLTVHAATNCGVYLNYSGTNRFDRFSVAGCGISGGIYAGHGARNSFSRGVVWNNRGYGINCQDSAATLIENCTVGLNTNAQVYIAGANTAVAMTNTIVFASGSSKVGVHWGSGTYAGDYNDLYATAGAYIGYCSGYKLTLAAWRLAAAQDANSISADPLLVAPASGDFHLQSKAGSYHGGAWTADPATSPAIDTGLPSSGYSLEPFPNGGCVDLGAYGNTAQASKSADSDGDGLSDPFELLRAGTNPAIPDSDSDGMRDGDERAAGTDPTNAASVFAVSDLTQPRAEQAEIRWYSVSGHVYAIHRATNLLFGGFVPIANDITATPPVNVYTDRVDGLGGSVFYRIRTQPQP
jgi:hypothetical protein